MEPYHSPAFPAPLGDLIFAAALGLFVVLEPIALKLRAREKKTWWASSGRDLVNALAAVSLSGAIWLLGMALPVAMLLGCSLTLALSVIGNFLHEKMERSWGLMLLIAIVLGLPFVVAPAALAGVAAGVVNLLFPNVVFPG